VHYHELEFRGSPSPDAGRFSLTSVGRYADLLVPVPSHATGDILSLGLRHMLSLQSYRHKKEHGFQNSITSTSQVYMTINALKLLPMSNSKFEAISVRSFPTILKA